MNNPDELAGLSAEVNQAVESARRLARTLPQDQRTAFETLIDGILDLTRQKLDLARENQALRNAGVDLLNRAEHAEAELAAMKRRIAEAPTQVYGRDDWPEPLIGQARRPAAGRG